MARVYATEGQLTAWLGSTPLPADPARALRAASGRVDDMLLSAIYDVDDDGMPTKASVITALTDATCAQVEYAMSIGDPNGTGQLSTFKSVSIGSVKLDRADGIGAGGAGGDGRYSREAFTILQREGLTGGEPWTF